MAVEGKLGIGRVLALSVSVFAARWMFFSGLMLIAAALASTAVVLLFFSCMVVIDTMPGGGGGLNFNDAQTAVMTVTLCAQIVAGLSILQIGAAGVAFGAVQHLRGQPAPFGRCLGYGFTVMLP